MTKIWMKILKVQKNSFIILHSVELWIVIIIILLSNITDKTN
jgi:hypothetical protein